MAKANPPLSNYLIYNPHGEIVCTSTESCRYSRDTELAMLESGYTIKLNGRKLTKKEIKDEKR